MAVVRSFDEHADPVGVVSFALAGRDSAELASWLGREHGIGYETACFARQLIM